MRRSLAGRPVRKKKTKKPQTNTNNRMNIKNNKPTVRKQSGFTLLELVIVIAILAVIGGAALVAYDGLDKKAAKSQATFNLAAIDKGVRLSRVITGNYPDELDLVVDSDATLADPTGVAAVTADTNGFFSRVPRGIEGADADETTGDGLFSFYPLSAEMETAFAEVGMNSFRGIPAASDTAAISLANRAFDAAPTGAGVLVDIAPNLVVPIVKTQNHGAADSSDLAAITGLPADTAHIVVALGLGNNSSIVSDDITVNSANFSEAPFYSDLASTEYGRFYLLFHIATDGSDGSVANDTIEAAEVFTEARFVGVLDAEGNWLDQEFADANGTKS